MSKPTVATAIAQMMATVMTAASVFLKVTRHVKILDLAMRAAKLLEAAIRIVSVWDMDTIHASIKVMHFLSVSRQGYRFIAACNN